LHPHRSPSRGVRISARGREVLPGIFPCPRVVRDLARDAPARGDPSEIPLVPRQVVVASAA
jgi:hypothetical protein